MPRGFIRKRPGPKGDAWELRVYVGRDELTGHERKIYRTVRGDKDTAERALRKLLDQLDDGATVGPDATFGALLERWQATKARAWSPKTAMETAGYVRRHLEPIKAKPLRKITPAALDSFYVDLGAKLQPSTVQRIHGIIRAALEQAVRWDWIARNPAARCEPVTGTPAEIRPPAPVDVQRLLAHLEHSHGDDEQAAQRDRSLGLFVRLAAVTGRRRGELCALRWSDIDWDHGTVTVARTLVDSQTDGWVERPISKNTRKFPPLALDPTTAAQLRAHRTATAERLLAVGLALPDNAHVFNRLAGKRLAPWSPDAVSHRFAKARTKAKLELRLHDLRHYVATTLIDEGVPLTTVAGRLGHGDGGRTTQEIYAHWVPATDRVAADLLGRLLDTPPADSDVG